MHQFRRTAIPLTIVAVLLGAPRAARAESTGTTRRPNAPLLEVGISPFVALGTAPSGAFGVALHAGLHWPSISFSIAVEGYGDAANPWALETFPDVRMKTTEFGGAIVPCWRPLFFLVCGVTTGSEVYASAVSTRLSGLKDAHSVSLRTGGRVGIGATVRDHLGLRLYGDVLGTIGTARAIINGKEVWRVPPLSGDVGATLLGYF